MAQGGACLIEEVVEQAPSFIGRVAKGFEFIPVDQQVTVREDRPESVTIRLERLDKARDKGWWDGANHFHMNYSGVYYNPPETMMFQGDAEDIHVLNNLICNKEQRIPDIAHFTGKPDPVSTKERILYHNQEYHPPFWGHGAFLNLKEHYVIPDYVGYQNTVVASLHPSNTVPNRVAREQGYEGKLLVKVFITMEGFVDKAEVIRSSGYRVLDRSALKSVEKWQFHPAEQFGVPVDSVLEIPFVFRLNDI